MIFMMFYWLCMYFVFLMLNVNAVTWSCMIQTKWILRLFIEFRESFFNILGLFGRYSYTQSCQKRKYGMCKLADISGSKFMVKLIYKLYIYKMIHVLPSDIKNDKIIIVSWNIHNWLIITYLFIKFMIHTSIYIFTCTWFVKIVLMTCISYFNCS